MGRVKSALEIALERSRRLAAQDSGHGNEWEEQQHRAVGENLARRFLQGEITTWDFQSHLERYQGKAREAVERAAVVSMARELGLDNYGKLLDGIAALKKDETTRRWLEETRRACEQFRVELNREEQEAADRWSERQREELASLGITGTAIAGFNFRASPEWRRLRQIWEDRLAAIRQRLVDYFAQ